MKKENLYVITIGHQVGSGGGVLGQKLSERLGIPLIDREILKWVSDQLNLAEAELELRQERLSSFWQSFSRTVEALDPERSFLADRYVPTDKELFQLESEYIERIAEKSSAIFLGRCGNYILCSHPRHLSVLVYASLPERTRRIQELYHSTEEEAKKFIETNDRARSAYIHTFARQNCLDPHLYDLCVNTSSLGMDQTVELVLTALKAKTRF
ncbi:MAG: AAA family ATPase [Omnitrophica WOR_2 bacterium]